jgi:hypothetical protein
MAKFMVWEEAHPGDKSERYDSDADDVAEWYASILHDNSGGEDRGPYTICVEGVGFAPVETFTVEMDYEPVFMAYPKG